MSESGFRITEKVIHTAHIGSRLGLQTEARLPPAWPPKKKQLGSVRRTCTEMLSKPFSYQAATVWEGAVHLPAITLLTPTSRRARRDRNKHTKQNKYDRSTPHFAPRMRGHVAVVASAWTPAVTVRAQNFRFSFTLNDMSTRRPTNRSNHQYHGNTQRAEWFRMVLHLV